MQKMIDFAELQRRLNSVFNEVAEDKIPYVLTRESQPEAVLIPYAEFLRFQAMQEQEILERFDSLIARM